MNALRHVTGLVVGTTMIFGALANAQADAHVPPPVAELWEECSGCHGEQGEGDEDMGAPRLNGQQEWYILGQLKKFRSEQRGADDENDPSGNMMMGVAQGIEHEASLAAISKFIAKMPLVAPQKAVKGGDAEAGAPVYLGNCTFCHGVNGAGIERLHAPRLAGQSDWYIIQQLNNFREGIRGKHNDDKSGKLMQSMSSTLEDEQAVLNVGAFISQMK